MSEILIFDQWFKQQPVASDLDATRYILAFDAEGNANRISTDSIMLHRGQSITDCNQAMKLGQYLPKTTSLLNAPPGFSINTSDTIFNVGRTSTWFIQFYFPYFQNASNANKFGYRTYAANTQWGEWKIYTMPTG